MAIWKEIDDFESTQLESRYTQAKQITEGFYEQKLTGTVYYISSLHGNDANNGKSQDSAWQHCEMLKSASLVAGDTVLFECGSLFRETMMEIVNGVSYSSYGQGEKPKFYGSIDASNTDDWDDLGGNLYRFKQRIDWYQDIGNIVFDGGKAWGIKIQKCTDSDVSLRLCGVNNGLETYEEIPSVPFTCAEQIPHIHLAYYHSEDGYIYLYCKNGNPTKVFSSIELSRSTKIFNSEYTENVTFSNLHFLNVGCFAIRTVGCKNIQVYNCSFEFIGGAVLFGVEFPWRNYRTRYGNAIENWGGCDGMTVKNCYFDQMYDTAITTQSNDLNAHQENLCYEGNVFCRTEWSIELWSGGNECRLSNINVQNNVCRDVGCGMTTQRPDKGYESFFCSRGDYQKKNCRVVGNLIYGSDNSMICCDQYRTPQYPDGFVMDDNIYLNRKGNQLALISELFPAYSDKLKALYYCEETVKMLENFDIEKNSLFYYC